MLHPRRFEDLVGQVYGEYFDCDVRHVGGPHDEGVDLFAVIGDEPCILQVKRRADPRSTEAVQHVRELIGTMILHDTKRARLVTTAGKFSTPAHRAANAEAVRRHGLEIQLDSLPEVYSMLQIVQRAVPPPWAEL